MWSLFDKIFRKHKSDKSVSDDKNLADFLSHFHIKTNNKHLYKLALTHGSFSDDTNDNERLEFIGDAVFGMVITEELYHTYPEKDEGKLTKLRSKIVGRQSLNNLGLVMGLDKYIYHKLGKNNNLSDSNYVGNAFEAFIGALYLDKGYTFTHEYIKDNFIKNHIDFQKLQETIVDYKSSLIIWSQKSKKNFQFNLVTVFTEEDEVRFKVGFTLDDKLIATGIGKSKKKAEQEAAKKALEKLGVLQ
jgi:ribonuclease III